MAAIEVYARADEVELKLNGVSLGRKKASKTCRTLFKAPWQPGVLTAVAYDDVGLSLGSCTLTSASNETELRLIPETETVQPNGLCYVRIRFIDENGIWKPLEHHSVHAEAENGTLVGLGCANSYVVGNYNGDSTDTYYGEALAILRANADGLVSLTVSSDDGLMTRVEIPVEGNETQTDDLSGDAEAEMEIEDQPRIVIPITLGAKGENTDGD